MVKPPTPISGVPLKRLQVRKDSASTVYSPASHVKSNLTVTIDKEWCPRAKRDVLVIRFDHGSLSLQFIKLHDARYESRSRSQSVAVDKEAKLLCLDAPSENIRVLSWFEDIRDFVVTVAVLQKAGFTVQMSSEDELAVGKSRSSSASRWENDRTSISRCRDNYPEPIVKGQEHDAQRQPSVLDRAPHNREASLSSLNSFQVTPRELSPWQLPLSSKGHHTHSPRVSSPLRVPASLVSPLSLDARGVSADPQLRLAHVPNFYRTVSVPVGVPHAFQQGQPLSLDQNYSQPLPQRVPSPVTTLARSDREDSRREGHASPRNISDYKDQLPRPRSLPFSPESKRAKGKSPPKVSKKNENGEMDKDNKRAPSPNAKGPTSAKKYKDNASSCNLSEPKTQMTVDSFTNTDSSIANNMNAATQTLPRNSTIDFILLKEDSDEIQSLQRKTLKLIEQYEADISSGYNLPRYAEFYATQIEALQTEFWHSQLYPEINMYDTDI